MLDLGPIHNLVAAVCPIDGISANGDGTFRVDYQSSATDAQRRAAIDVSKGAVLVSARIQQQSQIQATFEAACKAGYTDQIGIWFDLSVSGRADWNLYIAQCDRKAIKDSAEILSLDTGKPLKYSDLKAATGRAVDTYFAMRFKLSTLLTNIAAAPDVPTVQGIVW
jgi:acyl-CoA reductase-like NAD-dependent aldehyde dehydrogenase